LNHCLNTDGRRIDIYSLPAIQCANPLELEENHMLQEIKSLVESSLENVEATVAGEGGHFEVLVVGPCFEGKSLLQKQKMVYASLADKITSGEVHAITIKAYTAEEWKKASRFQVGSA